MLLSDWHIDDIEIDLDRTIFKIQSKKAFSLYERSIFNYLCNEDLQDENKEDVLDAFNIEEKIRKFKKNRSKKKILSFQTLSTLLTCSFIYFSCKGIVEHFKGFNNKNIRNST
ncbi:conserved Plasmodium protein, unknown function [Plasmodium relictum]|uniref:Uncharacterized protein n=1 Tax=Plasmodium relictum TaxID=85471 RepID=A0A1J1H431_PLARL|nr:conserved Plasmodium protein, unknown function [Plasmodium relictum]CRG99497.1 conserved Plasmodium protein, unknown function [Plasmodium relictum]